jgi:hypothetical protein
MAILQAERAAFRALSEATARDWDPAYPTLPLGEFEPAVRRFFSRPAPPPVRLPD